MRAVAAARRSPHVPASFVLVAACLGACGRGGGSAADAGAPAFPASFTPEADVPDWAAVRVEGQSAAYSATNGALYHVKWMLKKRTAPVEEYAYFDDQRALLTRLAATEGASSQGARVAFVGDLMWLGDHWDTFLGEDVKAELAASDAVIGNLETPVARGLPVPSGLPDYITYNAEPGLVASFRRPDGTNLFAALSLANNHLFDRGDEGARRTLALLDEERVQWSGVRPDEQRPRHVVVAAGGARVGFAATTWGFNNGVAAADSVLRPSSLPGLAPEDLNTPALEVDLSDARSALEGMARDGVDFRILGVHWGHEFEAYPTPPTVALAHELVAMGADVVVGAHPHVQQPGEVCFVNGAEGDLAEELRPLARCKLTTPDGRRRRAIVLYSLGNFVTNMWTFGCELGVVARVRLARDRGAVPAGHAFVHNLRRSRTGERRLALLSTYLERGCDRDGGCPADVRRMAELAARHLEGVHLSDAERAELARIELDEARAVLDAELGPAAARAVDAVPTASMIGAIRARLDDVAAGR